MTFSSIQLLHLGIFSAVAAHSVQSDQVIMMSEGRPSATKVTYTAYCANNTQYNITISTNLGNSSKSILIGIGEAEFIPLISPEFLPLKIKSVEIFYCGDPSKKVIFSGFFNFYLSKKADIQTKFFQIKKVGERYQILSN